MYLNHRNITRCRFPNKKAVIPYLCKPLEMNLGKYNRTVQIFGRNPMVRTSQLDRSIFDLDNPFMLDHHLIMKTLIYFLFYFDSSYWTSTGPKSYLILPILATGQPMLLSNRSLPIITCHMTNRKKKHSQ